MKTLFTTLCLSVASSALVFAGSNDPHSFKASTDEITASSEELEDVGDLRPRKEQGILSYFYGSAQAQGQYTTNSSLQGDHSNSDFLFLPTLQGGFDVPLGRGFSLDVLGRLESALYADATNRAFWGASVATTLGYKPFERGPRIYGQVQPYYYQAYNDDGHLASAIGLTAGIEQNVIINRGHTMLTGGYSFSQYYANPSRDDRDTNRFIVAVSQQLHKRVYAQLFYQFDYTQFEHPSLFTSQGSSDDRHDLRQILGLNCTYQITQSLFGTLGASLVDNDSNDRLADYQSFNVTAVLTYQF